MWSQRLAQKGLCKSLGIIGQRHVAILRDSTSIIKYYCHCGRLTQMPEQSEIIKVSFNQLMQAYRTSIGVEVNEQLPKGLDLHICIGAIYTLCDTGGDERHNVGAQHKRGLILEKGSLGFHCIDERFLGPARSMGMCARCCIP